MYAKDDNNFIITCAGPPFSREDLGGFYLYTLIVQSANKGR